MRQRLQTPTSSTTNLGYAGEGTVQSTSATNMQHGTLAAHILAFNSRVAISDSYDLYL